LRRGGYCGIFIRRTRKEPMKTYVIDFDAFIGDTVTLKTDREQLERVVTAIRIHSNNCVLYLLAQGTNESWHYGFELISINVERGT